VLGKRFFATKGDVKFDLVPFKAYRCDAPAATAVSNKKEMYAFWHQMSTMRRMEIVADNLYKQKMIRGFCHLYDGQEAIASGMEAAITKKDYLITAYREHCQQLGRGDTVESVIAELLGRSSGCSRGKGGSMHMYRKEANFFGGNGIVGAQIPLGTGLAFASKYRKEGAVSIAMFGDGASNQGQLWEAANMAYLWKLPMIYCLENNQYGMGTSTQRASSNTEFYTRMDVIPGLQVDGHDVLAVREAFKFAATHCRSGKGPIYLELKTYRYHGHSMSDPGITYRSREEVQKVRLEKDCVEKAKNRLLENGWATEAELKEATKEIFRDVDAAVERASAAPELTAEQIWEDIYQGPPPPFIRAADISDSKVFSA